MPESNASPRKKTAVTETGLRWVGYVLIVLTIFPILSIVSYDSGDVFWLKAPRNDPPNNLIGIAGAVGTAFGYRVLGLGLWLLPVWLLAFSIRVAAGRNTRPWARLGWCVLFQAGLCALLQLGGDLFAGVMDRLNTAPDAGGIVGWLLMTKALEPLISPVGGALVALTLMLVALIMGIGPHNVAEGFAEMRERLRQRAIARADMDRRLELEEKLLAREMEKQRKAAERQARLRERDEAREAREAAREARQKASDEEKAEKQRAYEERKEGLREERERETARLAEQRDAAAKAARDSRQQDVAPAAATEAAAVDNGAGEDVVEPAEPAPPPYRLPEVSLLKPLPDGIAVHGDIEGKSETLVRTLAEFNIAAEVTHIVKGPVVTSFELLPAPGIRVERIATMAKNLEMALKATSVRVEAPIPGKGVVGVEIPNDKACPVTVREILEGDRWRACEREMEIPALLGKNVSGQDLVIDLTTMPHLLVAGATGSGKSVCINALLTGLLMSRTPEQLRMMLIDPKIVEFAVYNELPHLVVPVITDPKKVSLGLRWAIHEMEKRYKLLSAAGVRNIAAFNRRHKVVQPDLFCNGTADKPAASGLPDSLPYILIVIDELADLMLQAGPEIENSIARLAQLSRAVGIHLIIATQRPSVNVITGTIKANFPGRIAFQVAQRVDSRTILDSMGAETLIGKGDMLFLNPRTSKLVRGQGAYIDDEDAKRVVDYIREQSKPVYIQEVQERLESSDEESDGVVGGGVTAGIAGSADDAGDELYEPAVDLVRRTKRASTSSLQRAFRVGYTRAARLMDMMEANGIVGPVRGSDPREILIDFDGEIPNNTDMQGLERGGGDASGDDVPDEP